MTNEELLQRHMDGDASALEQLYEQNIGLIKRIAEKCLMGFGYLSQDAGDSWNAASHIGELRQELFSEGTLAFCEQVYSGTYDPSRGKLTTYFYPHIKGAMYRWLERYKNDEIRTVSTCDLMPAEEDSEPFEFPDTQSQSVDQIVYQKLCLESLQELFDGLSERDRSILGHSFGVYEYEKYSLNQLGLKEMLTTDGVIKARTLALRHMQELYSGSLLQAWRIAHGLLNRQKTCHDKSG